MANSYTATREQTGVLPIYHPSGVVAVYSKFALTAALGNGDTIKLCKIPAFAVMVDTILATDELDTNGTAAITYSVGDATTAGRFILGAAQSNGVALGPTHMNVAAGLGYQYTADTDLLLTVTHAAGTAAATGNVYFIAKYSFEAITATAEGQELP